MRKLLSAFLILSLSICLFAGCEIGQTEPNGISGADSSYISGNDDSGADQSAEPVEVDFSQTDEDMFSNRDSKTDYDASQAVTVRLNGTTASASSDSVKISGSTVQLTEEATYVISGTLSDGRIVVNAQDSSKLQLVFNGVNITSKSSAALYISEADKVFVTLADGTVNTLANGGTFEAIDDNNIDGTVFSKQDLTFNGGGSLTVTSPGGHGIVCKDDLVFTGGNYTVQSSSHGLDANDSVRITNAALSIDAGKDMIHAENSEDAAKGFIYIAGGTVTGEAEGDGIAAGAYIQIEDCTMELLVGGGAENGSSASSGYYGGFMGGGHGGGMLPGGGQLPNTSTEDTVSMKGIKAASGILISEGAITVNSADDGIHSDASITINGGSIAIASGDDAVHAEETLTVTSGKIDISESYEGLEALHIDIHGGEIRLAASDDGLNAAGGTDSSGVTGGRDGMFGGGRPGGFGGMSGNSNGSIKISGGTLYIKASGDGIDANGTLEISGGYTVVIGPTQGDTATLDYDRSGVITGGTFIGTGAANMAQSFSDSQQGVIALRINNQAAGTQILLKDSQGNVIIDYAPELSFAVVILSSPRIEKGESYTVTIGSMTDEWEAS